MIFRLHEDVKVQSWRRYFYEVEAETLEEAVQLVKDEMVDCYDSEEFYDCDIYMKPEENNGEATQEIYLTEGDELLYTNTDDLDV